MGRILVNMGEGKIGSCDDSLGVIGLGSCIALVIYDEIYKIAAMAHIMLPCSKGFKDIMPYKFADTAPKLLVNDLLKRDAKRYNLKSKIAGGAFMFGAINPKSDVMRIGERNINDVKRHLSSLGIPLVSQEVGGGKGRTVEFFVESQVYTIKSIGEKPVNI